MRFEFACKARARIALAVLASVALAAIVPGIPRAAAQVKSPKLTGVLVALDLSSGKQQWRVSTPGTFGIEDVSTDSVVGRGFPCVGPPFETMAFDGSDGQRLWSAPAAEDFASSRGGDTLAPGSTRTGIVLSRAATRLNGLNVSTGKRRWSTEVTPSTFVVTNSRTVVTASTKGSYQSGLTSVVRGLERSTGKELWTVSDAASDRPFAAADNQTVVALLAHQDGSPSHVRALDPRSGAVRWEIEGADATPAGSVVAVVHASRTGPGSLSVVDAKTGAELWSRPGTPMGTFPMGPRLGLLDETGLSVVEARTGRQVWALPGVGRPIATDGRFVATAEDRTVKLLDARTGSPSSHLVRLPSGYEAINTFVVTGRTLYAGLGCSPNAG